MATQSAWTDELKAKVIEMYEQCSSRVCLNLEYGTVFKYMKH